jgi:hypothetical protein
MRPVVSAVLLLLIASGPAAVAQSSAAPLAPPVSPALPAAPSSGLSPILTQPSLARQPFGRAAVPAAPPAAAAPVDQQKMQAYRNGLVSQQRALESQGIGLGSEQYRAVQQQLNQLNGSSR